MRNYLCRFYEAYLNRSTHQIQPNDLSQSAVVFAPHQDDETLGCGGTIIKKKRAGADVKIIFMTDGTTSHSHLMAPAELKKTRAREAEAACQMLGVPVRDVFFLEFKDGRLVETQAAAVAEVVKILQVYQPAEIFVPYQREPPLDHSVTHRVVLKALSLTGNQTTVYEYPVWAWYQWPWVGVVQRPRRATLSILKNTFFAAIGLRLLKDFNHTVPIEDVLKHKRAALEQHHSQMSQLLPDSHWLTLNDVAQGQWLACFFREREIFRRYRLPRGNYLAWRE